MISSTFDDIAEVASKKYDQNARKALEKQLTFFTKDNSADDIKQLGLPQVLMFFSSSIAKSNSNEIILESDVEEAFALLRYVLTSDFVADFITKNSISLGLPQTEKKVGRLADLLRIKGDMKSKNNLDGKVSRLISFLEEQKLHQKHIKRLEIELKAAILLFSRLISIGRQSQYKISSSDIDVSYDIVRFLMFKLEPIDIKIMKELYQVDNEKIWRRIPKIVFDQTAHDHLSGTAYAEWENQLPENFETLKKHINCSSRPFVAAIFGYSEIFAAKKEFSRIGTDELSYVLEDFEKLIFGNLNPMIIEDKGVKISFTDLSLDLLSHISKWITTIIINKFGKDEFVFNFSTSVPRQISLLLFMAMVERIKTNDEKINKNHIYKAIIKWTNQLKILAVL